MLVKRESNIFNANRGKQNKFDECAMARSTSLMSFCIRCRKQFDKNDINPVKFDRNSH